MGTKKGQIRKTARRAYEPKKRNYRSKPKKRTRKQKVTLAQTFRSIFMGRNGRSKTEKLDDYNTIEELLYGGR